MKFRKVSSAKTVINELSGLLVRHLDSGEKVFWLVPGGSGMEIAVAVAKSLISSPYLNNLVVTLTDERYGEAGHPDSNWQQLLKKEFELPEAKIIPVLDGSDLAANAKHYARSLNKTIAEADYSIALAGMGADGHIFGIKPGSPSVDDNEEAVGYKWDDYIRLTPTIKFLKKLDEVVLYVTGTEKHSQIDDLAKDIEPIKQPAQLLKQLRNVTVYNDYKGDKV